MPHQPGRTVAEHDGCMSAQGEQTWNFVEVQSLLERYQSTGCELLVVDVTLATPHDSDWRRHLCRSLEALRQVEACPQVMSVVVTDRFEFLIQTFTSARQPLGRPVEVNAG